MGGDGVREDKRAFWRGQVEAWRAEVERARRSGGRPVSVREFCRARGLREPSFYFWRRELGAQPRSKTKRTVSESEAVFAPVTVRLSAAPIELVVAGMTLRVSPGFDETTLARLIAVLRPIDKAQGGA